MMMKSCYTRGIAGVSLFCLPFAASAESQTYVDLQTGIGHSTNPLARLGKSTGSAFGRVSLYGFHGWNTETSNTSLSAYVENNSYFRRYSNKQLFSFDANTSSRVSETVRIYGSLGFSGDFGGQLGSRYYGAPEGSIPIDPSLPGGFDAVVNPDLAAFGERQYRLSGQLGASFTLSPRDAIDASIGARRVFFTGDADVLNYTTIDTSVGYRRQINERVSVGARVIASMSNYTRGREVMSAGPQLTVSALLSENVQFTAAAGFVHTNTDFGDLGGKDSTTDLALDTSLCRTLANERMCARVARTTQSSVLGTATTSTSLAADYYRRLSAKDQIQSSLSVVRTDGASDFGLGRQSYYSLSGTYDREISKRFSAGVTLSARKFIFSGPNPNSDVGGSVFLRYRLGQAR